LPWDAPGSGRRIGLGAAWIPAWSALVPVLLLLALPLLAWANPCDPAWIPGVYDDADYDELVSAASSPDGTLNAPVLLVAPFLPVLDEPPRLDSHGALALASVSARPVRAPPAG
jgi:hypothetical protein